MIKIPNLPIFPNLHPTQTLPLSGAIIETLFSGDNTILKPSLIEYYKIEGEYSTSMHSKCSFEGLLGFCEETDTSLAKICQHKSKDIQGFINDKSTNQSFFLSGMYVYSPNKYYPFWTKEKAINALKKQYYIFINSFISENSLLQIALQKENKKESLTGTYFSIETEVRNLNLPTRVKKINRKIKLRIKKDYTISMYI